MIQSVLTLATIPVWTSHDTDNRVWEGWGSVMLVVGGMVLVAILLGIVIWQIFKTAQSRMLAADHIARDEAYRRLAEQSAATQEQLAAQQQRIADDLAELRERVGAIETLLREVG